MQEAPSSASAAAVGLEPPASSIKEAALADIQGVLTPVCVGKLASQHGIAKETIAANIESVRAAWAAAPEDAEFVRVSELTLRWSGVPVDGGMMSWPDDVPKFSVKDFIISRVDERTGKVVMEFALSLVRIMWDGTLWAHTRDFEAGYVTLRGARRFEHWGCAICGAMMGDIDTRDPERPVLLSPHNTDWDGNLAGRGVGNHYYIDKTGQKQVRWLDLENSRLLCELNHRHISQADDVSEGLRRARATSA